MNNKRIFSIYLPQFHPIPENDNFWFKGFTEWHNVAGAKPLFPDHYQPHVPGELGFYDLRLEAIMKQQCELAADYGVNGFMFYHYWFEGKPIMNIPLKNYLGFEQKLPYFFCWANENWTRRWDGGETDVLLTQDYSDDETVNHFSYLNKYFSDEAYLKIDGRPVLVVYKPYLIPDLRQWTTLVKSLAKENGFPDVYLIYMLHQGVDKITSIAEAGFDSAMFFEPSYGRLPVKKYRLSPVDKVGKLAHILKLKAQLPLVYRHNRIDYEEYVNIRVADKPNHSFKYFPMLFPSWDNSSRRKRGGANIFVGSTPQKFKKWLTHAVSAFPSYSTQENLVVINAWNEWAEGNHLEPCMKWGRQYLEAVKEVVQENAAEISANHK